MISACHIACSELQADTTLVVDGQPHAAVFVSERVWDDATKNPEPVSVWRTLKPEDNRRRLRESVRDFVGIVERKSGAKLPVEIGAPKAGDARVAILIGELATAQFGPPAKKTEYQQGLRIVVGNNAVVVCSLKLDPGVMRAPVAALRRRRTQWQGDVREIAGSVFRRSRSFVSCDEERDSCQTLLARR